MQSNFMSASLMLIYFRFSLLLSWLLAIQTCHAYQLYQEKIPNGEIVPHPCKANNLWRGVGHHNLKGGGARNPFGVDFKENGAIWDEAICKKDSDGDGKTNGEELGDPECIWSIGGAPSRNVGLSHPGICEPITDEDKCGPIPNWIDCEKEAFVCPVINEPETFNFTVRIPETPVPAEETTYICMFFELPTDQEYHMVANTPYIDNEAMMHHIVVSGCTADISKDVPLNTPRACGMDSGHPACSDMIAGWTVGVAGLCEHPHTGFLVGGNTGYKYASFQFHWNNPGKSSGYTDSSGMTFYLTPKLRLYNAGVLTIGQAYLEIPPGELSTIATGGCSSKCTSQYFLEPVNITTVVNHMHYLGKSQLTEVRRNGEQVEMLGDDKVFSYDKPVVRVYEDPLVARPGDDSLTSCEFRSTSRMTTTYFGDETADEMCLSIITFYPKESLKSSICVSWGTIDMCELRTGVIQGCNLTKLGDLGDENVAKVYADIGTKCALTHCRKECKEYIKVLKSTDPCYKGDVYKMRQAGDVFGSTSVMSLEELQLYNRANSCDQEIAMEKYIEAIGGEAAAACGIVNSGLACFVGLVLNIVLYEIEV